jgi:hypothetical protein
LRAARYTIASANQEANPLISPQIGPSVLRRGQKVQIRFFLVQGNSLKTLDEAASRSVDSP